LVEETGVPGENHQPAAITDKNFIFSEFILIFDLVFGFYCSEQKSRQNMEIKSY